MNSSVFLFFLAVDATLLASSFGVRSCSYNVNTTCTVFSSLSQLDPFETTDIHSILGYINSQGVWVQFESPIQWKMEILETSVQFPIIYSKSLYNKYEHFISSSTCPPGLQSGMCFDNTNPYVLCCLGNGPRRSSGLHCLVEDKTLRYDAFQLGPMSLKHSIRVTVTAKQNTRVFYVSNFASLQTIPDFGKVSMYVIPRLDNIRPYNIRFNNLLFSTENASIDQWFFVDKYQNDIRQLTRTREEWKAMARCSAGMHDETKTHGNADHVKDQYFTFRSNTVQKFITDNEYGTLVRIVDSNTLWVESRSDTVLIEMILENI